MRSQDAGFRAPIKNDNDIPVTHDLGSHSNVARSCTKQPSVPTCIHKRLVKPSSCYFLHRSKSRFT